MASLPIDNWNVLYKCVAGCLKDINSNVGLTTWEKIAWTNALGKAVANMESDDFLMHFDSQDQKLIIFTATTSGNCYETFAGTCNCKAFQHATPCWHRAAFRLITRYLKAINPAPESPSPLSGGGAGAAVVVPMPESVVKSAVATMAAPASASRPATGREMDNAPYLKNNSAKIIKFGGFRI